MYKLLLVFFTLSLVHIPVQASVDLVRVDKSEQKMYLLYKGRIVKSYHVALGGNPRGHKEKEGDKKTPEGKYILDYKNENSEFYKAIHISYPNEFDIQQARLKGVDPGGDIMIHGQKNGNSKRAWVTQAFNWTDGCIAVTNREMDEIWQLVNVGTPIEIRP